jgi:WhiB family transcriptional regulator, redox-sensing transcriptional regulator
LRDQTEGTMTTTSADHLAEWWTLAACQSADPELFFPISHSGPASAQIQRAKAVCARCVVADDCLRYALAADPLQGVWGGMSEEERRLLRRREQKARSRAVRRSAVTAGAARPPRAAGRRPGRS